MKEYNFSDVVKAEDNSITLSREFILSKISEENIFEHYGVPLKKGLFCSKLRHDNNPTVSIFRSKNSGRLIMKDFGSDFCGDCFAFVAAYFNTSYYGALKIIANDFGLIKKQNLIKNTQKLKYSNTTVESKKDAEIQVEIRNWKPYELQWWGSYGISEATLKKFKVFSCKNIWLNQNLFHLESPMQYIFGYYGGIKNGIERWKIYFPRKKSFKFLGNWKSSNLQGGKQLPKEGGEYLVITKAMKDCMVLYELGIPAVAPNSENCFVTDSQYKKLSDKFKNILVLYDNDLPGIKGLKRIREKYPEIKVAFIPRKYKAKDISDFYKIYGKDETLRLINEAKKYYFNVKEKIRSI